MLLGPQGPLCTEQVCTARGLLPRWHSTGRVAYQGAMPPVYGARHRCSVMTLRGSCLADVAGYQDVQADEAYGRHEPVRKTGQTWTSETLQWQVSCHHQLSALGASTRPTSSLSPCLPATASEPLRHSTPSEEVATPDAAPICAQMSAAVAGRLNLQPKCILSSTCSLSFFVAQTAKETQQMTDS